MSPIWARSKGVLCCNSQFELTTSLFFESTPSHWKWHYILRIIAHTRHLRPDKNKITIFREILNRLIFLVKIELSA